MSTKNFKTETLPKCCKLQRQNVCSPCLAFAEKQKSDRKKIISKNIFALVDTTVVIICNRNNFHFVQNKFQIQ